MQTLTINGKEYLVDAPDEMPLLWVLRDIVGLTGTKFGCGVAQCGACSVMIDEVVVRSCSTQVSQAYGREIITVENDHHKDLVFLCQAWRLHSVPQCGYCQPGQLISAAALLSKVKTPTDEDIDNAMSGNICRCGTYARIKQAIKDAAEIKKQQ